MIEKIDRILGRVFANDYAFFIIISLVFGGSCYLVSDAFYRLGIFSQSDVSSFAHYWVVGFFVAFYLHWRLKLKRTEKLSEKRGGDCFGLRRKDINFD